MNIEIDYKKARNLMVENQLRPNKINDPIILNLFQNIKKEDFILNEMGISSYGDLDINLDNNRGYLKNLHIAQLIQSAEILKSHKVLHIGGLTGYVSVILSKLCKELIVIESNANLSRILKDNIQKLNIQNIKIVDSDFKEGFADDSPYDIIFIDNPVNNLSKLLKEQVIQNDGTIIMIKKVSNDLCKAVKIIKNNNDFTTEYLFDVFTRYELIKSKEEFIF